MEKYVELVRELGRIPAQGDLRLKRRTDPSFPSDGTFTRLGSKVQLIAKAAEYCRNRTGFDDVLQLCAQTHSDHGPELHDSHGTDIPEFGFVYLLKSGRYYKIGRTNAQGRREYELAIQLPEKAQTVHVIRTDDPSGIEAYWHSRFTQKRANGEWFALEAEDVQAFKRRKFM